MRFYKKFFIVLSAGFIFACAGKFAPSTPLETLKAYTLAIKKKDTTQMKLLLSEASLKMAEQEAKAQNVQLDEIMKRETLFGENQRTVEHRNEKVDGDRATIEMKDSFETWVTVPFVREEGVWKIDKQGLANQMIQDIEDETNRRIKDKINESIQP
jgi:Na+-translocating ferredoxin:NAD+ oxidoreductase RnfG subunit